MQLHIFRVKALFGGYRSRQHRAGGSRQNPARVAVVSVDNRFITAAEQFCLGLTVGIHGLVEVQMILRQVGEGGDIKVDTAHTLQCQGVAGHLHDHMGAAGIPHPGEEGLQIQAFGGGALRGDDFLADHVRHGADKAHFCAQGLFQHLLEKQGGGGFAVGAGNTDHGHGLCGAAIEIAAQQRQRQPVGLYQYIGNVPVGLFGSDHRCGSLFQSHGNKPIAVGGKAGHRHKQTARLRLPGVVANGGDIRFQIRITRQNRNISQ